MGTASRVLSGSVASWSRIAVIMGTQIGLVPVFLGHWTVEQYGCWLVIQSLGAFVNIFSLAHHNYVGNEMLRIPGAQPAGISQLLAAALPFSVIIGLTELAFLGVLAWTGYTALAFDQDRMLSPALLHEATWALVITAIGTFLSACLSGLYGRVAGAYGHFPATAWWGVAIALISALVATALVLMGASLLQTALGVALCNWLVHLAYLRHLWVMVARHNVRLGRPDWQTGRRNALDSLGLGVTYWLSLIRQQGTRILVSITSGVAQAVLFSTMRTASNLALQGVATVVDPLFPEFMGFLRDRNRSAVIATFAFVWMLVVFLMGPSLVLLQAMAPELFDIWTRGKLSFDALVFGLFSIGMLVFGLARPAESIVRGNNLLRVQIVTAASLAVITIAGILWLDGSMGLRGVAVVLLVCELGAAAVACYRARLWMIEHDLTWPSALFRLAVASVLLCSVVIMLMAWWPDLRVPLAAAALVGNAALLAAFVMQLPLDQRHWLRRRALRFFPRQGQQS
jgi:O-antigen/teichoic acid export membrane protein